MNTNHYLLILIIILAVSLGFAKSKNQTTNIFPSKAFIIFTCESWGCMSGQELKEDVSAGLQKDDHNFATIQEIKNPDDVFNRYELYLIFPAKPVNGLSGNFVVRFWCNNDEPETTACLSMDYARLNKKKDEKWFLSIKAKSNGFVHAKMLYSRTPEMRQAWFACPESVMFQPQQLTFFNVYPLEGNFEGLPEQKLSDKWQALELTLNPIFLEQSELVDKCQAFLQILDKQFAVDNRPLVWERKKIQDATIQTLIRQVDKSSEEKMTQVVLNAEDGATTYVGSDRLLPHLRQKIALKNPDGNLVGAELWLRAKF